MGLVEPNFSDPPEYRLRTDFGGILRYDYCTPDFMLGSLMTEARPNEDWAAISSQNRWYGAIFRGQPDARIYPWCVNVGNDSTYNQQWAVQHKGTPICQKLKTNRHAGPMRVWFSKAGLSAPIRQGPWVFAEAAGAWAGVRVAAGGAEVQENSLQQQHVAFFQAR